MGAPTVTALDANLLLGNSLLASGLFIANDPDFDPITQIQVIDDNSSATSGYFQLSGTGLAAGVWHTVASGDLANLLFIAGATIQSDAFRIRVFDGTSWSAVDAGMVYTVRANTTPPVVAIDDFTIVAYEKVKVSTLFSAYDLDGYPIQRYRFYDRTDHPHSGHFELGGVAQPQRTWLFVQADQLDSLYYVAPVYHQTEIVDAVAYDGAQWSARDKANAIGLDNANRPVVQPGEFIFEAGTLSAIESLFTWTDEDANTLKSYRFYDTDASPSSGYIEYNGVKQPAGQWIDIPVGDLDQASWIAAADDRTELLRVQVFDGRFRSIVQTVEVLSIKRPGLSASGSGTVLLRDYEVVDFAPAYNQTTSGPQFTQFQVVDLNADSRSGYLSLDGAPLAAGVVYSFTPAQFNRLQFVGGVYEMRSLDEVIVRGFNVLWSPWTEVTFRTEPEYNTAMNAGFDWTDILTAPGSKPRIPYSFMQALPGYDTGDANADNFGVFTNAQRLGARKAIQLLEAFVNIDLYEVPDSSTNEFGEQGGLIRFGNLYYPDGVYYSYSYFPDDPVQQAEGGDVWINTAYTDSSDLTPGTTAFSVMLNEVAHAAGIKYAYQAPPGLPAATNNMRHTVMVFMNPLLAPPNPNPLNYLLYDALGMQAVYGKNTATATGNNLYDWQGYWNSVPAFSDMIWDNGGHDTISAAGGAFANRIDLREGAIGTLGTRSNNLAVAFGSIIEDAIGGAGADQIYGNPAVNALWGGAGDDFLSPGPADDSVFGEAGNDIYEWMGGDGNDTYNELAGGGDDELRFGYVPGMTVKGDFLDLRFRLSGADLQIDLRVDNVLEAELRVINQTVTSSRIETLNFVGTRVDLVDLTSQLSPSGTPRSFSITDNPGTYGFLAIPV